MKKIDKAGLVQKIQIELQETFEKLKQAALATYEDATHEESKPENEYDTRGLEASYLAGAQANRVAELEEVVATYRHLEIKDFPPGSKIQSTALVEVQCNGKKSWVFIMSKGGGII